MAEFTLKAVLLARYPELSDELLADLSLDFSGLGSMEVIPYLKRLLRLPTHSGAQKKSLDFVVVVVVISNHRRKIYLIK